MTADLERKAREYARDVLVEDALPAIRGTVEAAFLAGYGARAAEEDWQDISTAPRDGTRVLVSRGPAHSCIASWSDNGWFTDRQATELFQLRLWRPLPFPAPPSNHKSGETR